ncbi:TRAP transporter large permease [Undibacter mobilis]|uniref:C4-dicarboxylate ABC transporter n=1 Tax=Undibacter mobilis TaxID=2292256 RepID=A0A371B3D5_9BRAD|nr:TRAP transporter large permease subunit [Undibacter mobilis]RDV01971.1 C4-dicarboxylate ABC transporter [Undibacter mobilis]
MIAFIIENMAPIMFVSLVVFLLLGYPAAFSLAAVGLIFALIGIELGQFQPDFLQAMPERVYGVMNNDTLLAIPFFTFMGLILERSGMAEDLLDTIGQLFGTVRGGLAYAVIFVGALLAATTGVVAASVISMGLISLPIMLRYGYDRRVASGVIAASGTLAQIIPPSLVLIVMADQLGKSVGDMYEGAFIPGLVLSALYAGYIFLVTLAQPKAVPGLPLDAIGFREPSGARGVWQLGVLVVFSGIVAYLLMTQTNVRGGADFVILTMSVGVIVSFLCAVFNRVFGTRYFYVSFILFVALAAAWYYFNHHNHENWALLLAALSAGALYAVIAAVIEKTTGFRLMTLMAEQTTFVMVPPLFLIFLVLGTIFIGVATPTEGGAMGAVGALILGAMKRRLTFDLIRQAVESTAKLSAFVVFILLGARVFSLTFYGVSGHIWVEHLLTSLPGGATGFLIFVNALVFVLAFFLDFFELAFIVIPLLGPAAEKLGIDLIWFGVILGVNMQTSFMHPPFGFALFYLRSVAPKENYTDRVTGLRMEPVTTGQIYWGAVPFVCIQLIMVALVIIFPSMVMHYKKGMSTVDPNTVKIEVPALDNLPPLDLGPPTFK